ncbi:CLUMA_CG000445, isoform A [Clunio marinus]|uniref:CLUMA_CG000445, isoform A n=1 Tax=Clunio marinus TaxID=568069 RepID=A0A1J1HF63_9DIPT|nr:CLUMA_CG000445, isoform A [Clunio marinus]
MMKCLNKLTAIFLIITMFMSLNYVLANECVQCPSASANEYVCGVDDKGAFRKFGSECLLRFENCDKKTKFEITDKSLCD